jgi:hypothetical protein
VLEYILIVFVTVVLVELGFELRAFFAIAKQVFNRFKLPSLW